MDCIIDVDGTVADCEHRRHWIHTKPKNYDAFHAGCALDTPIQPVIQLVRALDYAGSRLVFCSGRPEKTRAATLEWLSRHVLAIKSRALYMRADGDYRQDDAIKLELLDRIIADGYQPSLAIDDRNRVVTAWRSRGIVCAQVAEGNF